MHTPQRPPPYWPRPDELEPSTRSSTALGIGSAVLGAASILLALFGVSGIAIGVGVLGFGASVVVVSRRRQSDGWALTGLVLALTGCGVALARLP